MWEVTNNEQKWNWNGSLALHTVAVQCEGQAYNGMKGLTKDKKEKKKFVNKFSYLTEYNFIYLEHTHTI